MCIERGLNEKNSVNAESEYGRFKINCENMLIEELGANAVILRLSMIFGKNSLRLDQMRDAIDRNKPIAVFENVTITGSLDFVAVNQFKFILENELKGIFHIASSDCINQLNFYKEILGSEDYLSVSKIEDAEKYYLAISSSRKEIKEMEISAEELILKIKSFLFVNNWRKTRQY